VEWYISLPSNGAFSFCSTCARFMCGTFCVWPFLCVALSMCGDSRVWTGWLFGWTCTGQLPRSVQPNNQRIQQCSIIRGSQISPTSQMSSNQSDLSNQFNLFNLLDPYESTNTARLSKLESPSANSCLSRYNWPLLKVILDCTYCFLNIMSGFVLAMSGPWQQ